MNLHIKFGCKSIICKIFCGLLWGPKPGLRFMWKVNDNGCLCFKMTHYFVHVLTVYKICIEYSWIFNSLWSYQYIPIQDVSWNYSWLTLIPETHVMLVNCWSKANDNTLDSCGSASVVALHHDSQWLIVIDRNLNCVRIVCRMDSGMWHSTMHRALNIAMESRKIRNCYSQTARYKSLLMLLFCSQGAEEVWSTRKMTPLQWHDILLTFVECTKFCMHISTVYLYN